MLTRMDVRMNILRLPRGIYGKFGAYICRSSHQNFFMLPPMEESMIVVYKNRLEL